MLYFGPYLCVLAIFFVTTVNQVFIYSVYLCVDIWTLNHRTYFNRYFQFPNINVSPYFVMSALTSINQKRLMLPYRWTNSTTSAFNCGVFSTYDETSIIFHFQTQRWKHVLTMIMDSLHDWLQFEHPARYDDEGLWGMFWMVIEG